MRYLPKSPDERRQMLQVIGCDSVEQLFDSIPAEVRRQRPLALDAGKSEPEILAYFRARAAESPASAAFWMDSLDRLAETGIDRAAADDADGFLNTIRDYAGGLQALGEWMGAAIFTPEHLEMLKLAERFGLAYKVSGAGGGDLGLAFGADPEALAGFRKAADGRYDTIDLAVDPLGLDVEIVDR